MRGLLKRDTLVGWAFAALGYFLITSHFLVTDNLLHLRAYSLALFPRHLALQYFFMGFSILALLAAAGLCFVTGWGVGHRRRWARWTGLMPCLYLLPGFPYLTPVGLLGLCYLWKQQVEKPAELTAAEFWNPRRQSGWMLTASILGWFVARLAFTGLQVRAYRLGLPPLDSAGPGLVAFLFLMWGHVGLHECGHALAAKAVGFRVKVLAIGPFVLSKEEKRYRLHLNWLGLLLLGGYMGAVPVSVQRFRLRQSIVVAAGPITSLASGLALLGVWFLLPGTALAGWWQIVGMGAVSGIYLGLINLAPFGYCDGTMLFHMLLRTRRGEELITLSLRGANLSGPPVAERDYEDQAQHQLAVVQQMLDSGEPDPVKLGRQFIQLGSVQMATQNKRDAERHLIRGLRLLPENAALLDEATGWECLQILRLRHYDDAGAAEAYGKALTAARKLKETATDMRQRLSAAMITAALHHRAHAWPELLDVATEVLTDPSTENSNMSRGLTEGWKGQALLHTGRREEGLEAVERGAAILRAIPGLRGPHQLGLLGEVLWTAGQTEPALSLITECIALLQARGAIRLAVSFRLYLVEVLRLDGQVARAGCVLPQFDRVAADTRGLYYERRGSNRLTAGKLEEAIADLKRALAIQEQDASDDEVELAESRGRLAAALAEAGDLDAAETLARESYATLSAIGHPGMARACVALAIIGGKRQGDAAEYVEAALRFWESVSLLLPSEKARELEDAARSLEAAGLAGAAVDFRAASAGYWEQAALVRSAESVAASV